MTTRRRWMDGTNLIFLLSTFRCVVFLFRFFFYAPQEHFYIGRSFAFFQFFSLCPFMNEWLQLGTESSFGSKHLAVAFVERRKGSFSRQTESGGSRKVRKENELNWTVHCAHLRCISVNWVQAEFCTVCLFSFLLHVPLLTYHLLLLLLLFITVFNGLLHVLQYVPVQTIHSLFHYSYLQFIFFFTFSVSAADT